MTRNDLMATRSPGDSRVALRRLALAAALLLAVSGCGAEGTDSGSTEPASVLLITMDTTRSDYLGCYGREETSTPHLDGLAKEGVRFEEAYTVCPLTLPSHATILTGLLPFRHQVRDNGTRSLRGEFTTLAEILQAQGYETAGFVAAVVLSRRYGVAQGFDEWQEPVVARTQERTNTSIPAGQVNEKAIAWIEQRDPQRPFFLWVHYFDPHSPYEPPEELQPGGDATPYDGEISAMDHAIGQVLDAVASSHGSRELMTIAVADHGEGLGFRGEPTHGHLVYQPHVRVPLLIRYPDGWQAGAVRTDPVSVADVLPTVLDTLGLVVDPDIDGRSLRGDPGPVDRAVYFESYYSYFAHGWSPLVGIATRDYKYIHGSEPELYHVEVGGMEAEDLADRHPGQVQQAAARLRRMTARARQSEVETPTVSAEELEHMRALGYTSMPARGGIPDPFDLEPDLASPNHQGETIRRFRNAVLYHPDWNSDEAIAELTELMHENPDSTAILIYLGRFLVEDGRHEEARAPLERLVELRPQHGEAWVLLGLVRQAAGEHQQALGCFRKASELDPLAVDPLQKAIPSMEALGQVQSANKVRERIAEIARIREQARH